MLERLSLTTCLFFFLLYPSLLSSAHPPPSSFLHFVHITGESCLSSGKHLQEPNSNTRQKALLAHTAFDAKMKLQSILPVESGLPCFSHQFRQGTEKPGPTRVIHQRRMPCVTFRLHLSGVPTHSYGIQEISCEK